MTVVFQEPITRVVELLISLTKILLGHCGQYVSKYLNYFDSSFGNVDKSLISPNYEAAAQLMRNSNALCKNLTVSTPKLNTIYNTNIIPAKDIIHAKFLYPCRTDKSLANPNIPTTRTVIPNGNVFLSKIQLVLKIAIDTIIRNGHNIDPLSIFTMIVVPVSGPLVAPPHQ